MSRIFTLIFVLIFFTSSAQNLKISGKVFTGETKDNILGATVRILNSQIITISNADGEFEIAVDPGSYTLRISHVGYAKQQKEVTLTNDPVTINFELIPNIKALDEVIVTSAAKTEGPLLEVPASITRFDAENVGDLRLWNQRQMNALTGNLSVINFGEGDGNNYSIRGITSLNFDPSVATYIDGINQFDIYSNIEFLHDVESIEILKGPQGTLFGRNALGGVINITTKQPTNEWRGKAEVSIGNFGLQRYDVAFSGPIIKDKLYFSASGLLGQQDGYFTNTFDNSNFNSKEYGGGSLSLKYDISDNWSLVLNGKLYQRDVVGYVPAVANDSIAFANPFEVSQDAVGGISQDLTQTSLKLQYTGSDFNFSNVLSIQTSDYAINNVDIDFTALDISTFTRPIQGEDNVSEVFTNEFTFSNAAGANKLKWVMGTYVFRQQLPIKQLVGTGQDGVDLDPNISEVNQILNFTEATNRGFAGFGQVTYPLSSKLDIIGGIRYDYEEREFNTRSDLVSGDNPPVNIAPERIVKTDFDAFSPKLGFTWNVNRNTNFYIMYTRGYRIGGTNTSLDPRFEGYDPETSDNFELGVKGRLLQNKLEYELSAFYIGRNNIQIQSFEPGSEGTSFVILTSGEGRNLGFEMGLNYLIAEGLQLSYNLGVLDAEYTSLQLPDETTGDNETIEDMTAIFSPPFTSSLMLDYIKQIKVGTNSLTLDSNIQWVTQGKNFFDLINAVSQDPYSLFNARIGAGFKGMGLHFWIQNILDGRYIQWTSPIGAPNTFLGPPRTYGISLSYQFN